jgi:molybdate transport system substrate-binding protein
MPEANGVLRLLSGGAAAGLVGALAPRFRAETGWEIAGEFSAVGAMAAKLRAGAPADLLLLTEAAIGALEQDGFVAPASRRAIGVVDTGIAIREADPRPAIADADALRAALLSADAIYLPDPVQATAGIHVASVLGRLGIGEAVAARLRPFPNGATAMRELAASGSARPIGATQVTEILATSGVMLLGNLPEPFALATTYVGAVAQGAAAPDEARRLLDLLAGEAGGEARRTAGFSGD